MQNLQKEWPKIRQNDKKCHFPQRNWLKFFVCNSKHLCSLIFELTPSEFPHQVAYSLLLSIWSKKMQLTTLTYAFKQKLIHRTYNIYVQKRSRNFIRGKRQSCSLLHNEQLCCLLRLGYQRPIQKSNSDQRLSARNSKNNFACFVFLAFKNFDLRLAKKLRLGKHYLTEAFKNILFFCPLYTYP